MFVGDIEILKKYSPNNPSTLVKSFTPQYPEPYDKGIITAACRGLEKYCYLMKRPLIFYCGTSTIDDWGFYLFCLLNRTFSQFILEI